MGNTSGDKPPYSFFYELILRTLYPMRPPSGLKFHAITQYFIQISRIKHSYFTITHQNLDFYDFDNFLSQENLASFPYNL